MNFIDRTSENPNRVKITYEDSGASVYATMEMADTPIQEGTPLNKATFDKFTEDLQGYADGKNFIGSVVVTSTNNNPSNILGGTWELYDKGFEPKQWFQGGYNKKCFYGLNLYRSGNLLKIAGELTPNNEIGEDAPREEFFEIDFESLGLDLSTWMPEIVSDTICAQERDAHAQVVIEKDGCVYMRKARFPGDAETISPLYTIRFETIIPATPTQMIDDYCDKFFWKRTA